MNIRLREPEIIGYTIQEKASNVAFCLNPVDTIHCSAVGGAIHDDTMLYVSKFNMVYITSDVRWVGSPVHEAHSFGANLHAVNKEALKLFLPDVIAGSPIKDKAKEWACSIEVSETGEENEAAYNLHDYLNTCPENERFFARTILFGCQGAPFHLKSVVCAWAWVMPTSNQVTSTSFQHWFDKAGSYVDGIIERLSRQRETLKDADFSNKS